MAGMPEPIDISEGRPFTVRDLEGMPDDGRRYELIDGMLHVTPGPTWSHQEMTQRLFVLLDRICPPELRVMLAPYAVRTSVLNEVQPDVQVARYDDLTEEFLPVGPLLAVETLSRSTRLYDRNTKKAHYELLGVPSYWLLNPTPPGSLEVIELDEHGQYQLVATVTGDETYEATRPFPVSVCPARLLDRLKPRQ